jgi:predicted MPP superfamily phosphohydrolase
MIGLIFGVILLGYVGLNVYIARRLFQALTGLFPGVSPVVYGCVYAVVALSFMGRWLPLPSAVKSVVSSIGSVWLGAFVYLLLFFLVADIVLLVGRLTRLIPAQASADARFYANTAAVLAAVALVCVGLYTVNQTRSVSYDVALGRSLPEPMKVVLVSDLHLGDTNSEALLESVVQEINDQDPDIVCIVGDIFSDDYHLIKHPDQASALLKSIETEYGVYASLGNHDRGSTFDEMMDFLERSDITLLNDESVVIDERLVLVGRVDPSATRGSGDLQRKDFSQIPAPVDTDLPVVVMEHNPSHIDEYGNDVDLILSGHTHKGQVFPGNLITAAVYTVDYGHYQKNADSPHVIVTSGAGTWGMRLRVGTNNEVVSIVLR